MTILHQFLFCIFVFKIKIKTIFRQFLILKRYNFLRFRSIPEKVPPFQYLPKRSVLIRAVRGC